MPAGITLAPATSAGNAHCPACHGRLFAHEVKVGVCDICREHPVGRRILVRLRAKAPLQAPAPERDFTTADKALIGKLHHHLQPTELLDLLNDRLQTDVGPAGDSVAGGADWAGLRRQIAEAARSGLLDTATPQMLDDFAVVFSLSPSQSMRAKDTILAAKRRGLRGLDSARSRKGA